ncbi:MAG: tRNA 4-thiouridine(8) synthase ThiI [Lachnospiraceae bacterium]|nr:tRNA 4-thiouridine(8) synthase ThiI [Lachnospiraceae bacterium]
MNFRAFLIKYAEIGIKGKNRYLFEDALMKQIRRALRRIEGNFKVTKEDGRIYVMAEDDDFDEEDVYSALQHVFGIQGICPMLQVEDEGWEKLCETVVSYMKETYGEEENYSFKVQARRARKNYPLNSNEICYKMGEAILNEVPNVHVDVHKPDVMLHIEIRQKINIYSKTVKGPGGMPIGTNGKAMLLLSGGIDSPVAGYMIAKRGVVIDAVYFHAPPYTSERAKQKVIDLAREVAAFSGPINLHIVNFTDIQLAIYEKCPHDELTIIMRRYMMKIAQDLAEKTGCLALITGESIGQVASQTMQSMAVTNEVCTMPVYRPLVGFDKQDIVEISQQIGTFETSILPYEDCCTIFVAKHPVTKPYLKIIKRSEQNLNGVIEELYETAINTVETVWCESEA